MLPALALVQAVLLPRRRRRRRRVVRPRLVAVEALRGVEVKLQDFILRGFIIELSFIIDWFSENRRVRGTGKVSH